jgi:hypothetical protein
MSSIVRRPDGTPTSTYHIVYRLRIDNNHIINIFSQDTDNANLLLGYLKALWQMVLPCLHVRSPLMACTAQFCIEIEWSRMIPCGFQTYSNPSHTCSESAHENSAMLGFTRYRYSGIKGRQLAVELCIPTSMNRMLDRCAPPPTKKSVRVDWKSPTTMH